MTDKELMKHFKCKLRLNDMGLYCKTHNIILEEK